jgi:hypothetical protein
MKKRAPQNTSHRITAAAVAAFVAADEAALREALELKPWQFPTLVPLDEPAPEHPSTMSDQWWSQGQALHRALMAAAAAHDDDAHS